MRLSVVVLLGISLVLAVLPSVLPQLNAPVFYIGAGAMGVGAVGMAIQFLRRYEVAFRPRVSRQTSQIRIRLANPPDDCDDQHYAEWVHISVTNDGPRDVRARVSATWNNRQNRARLRWEPDASEEAVIPKDGRQARRFLFCVYSQHAFDYYSQLNPRGALTVREHTCAIADDSFHFSTTVGETLPTGRTDVSIEVDDVDTGATTSTRFAVYVPRAQMKSLWVVPIGESGSE